MGHRLIALASSGSQLLYLVRHCVLLSYSQHETMCSITCDMLLLPFRSGQHDATSELAPGEMEIAQRVLCWALLRALLAAEGEPYGPLPMAVLHLGCAPPA